MNDVQEIKAGAVVHIEGLPFRLEASVKAYGVNWSLLSDLSGIEPEEKKE